MSTNIDNIIAINDGTNTAGAIALWSLSGDIDRAELVAAWGEESDDLPELVRPLRALRRAVQEQAGQRRRLVRPIRNGFALVDEHEADADLDYRVAAKATLEGAYVHVTTAVDGLEEALRSAYRRHLGVLDANDVSCWLVREMDGVDAVGLRERGGVYFIPPAGLPRVERIAKALEVCSRHRVYRIPAMRTEEAVEAVLAAVGAEATAAINSLQDDLNQQRYSTPRGWAGRTRDLDALEGKIARYEGLLGRKLEWLGGHLASVRAGIAAASLACADGEDNGGLGDLAAFGGLAL